MYLDEQKVAALSNLHEAFIKKILHEGELYYIKNDETLAIIDSSLYDGYESIPFFTTYEQAYKFQQINFEDFNVVSISTKKFIENWLVSLLEMELVLALIWSDDLNGKELAPYDMMVDTVNFIQQKSDHTDINIAEMAKLINSIK